MTKEQTKEEINLELWEKVCETDPVHTKKVKHKGSREYTAIDAYYQLRNATEEWGKYGETWGIRDCKWSMIECEGKVSMVLDAMFFCPDFSFEISSDMAFRHGGDCRKKLQTDVLTKALSKLGFNTDVFLGMYDDNKYIQHMEETFRPRISEDQVTELKDLIGDDVAKLGGDIKTAFGATSFVDILEKDFAAVIALVKKNQKGKK